MLLIGTGVFFISACSDDDDNGEPFELTQTALDESTNEIELGVTGQPFGGASIPHGGSGEDPDSTIRDVYSNKSSLDGGFEVGSIITKHTYKKNPDGSKGQLLVTFAMVKMEEGYYPEGGNWQYVKMPNDGTTDYGQHPNGSLPPASAENRGKLGCIGCHNQAEEDFVFVND